MLITKAPELEEKLPSPNKLLSNTTASYLGKCSYSVLTRKQWWIFSDLEIEVHSFVCESRELIAKAELVCSIPGCSKCEAIILFLHLFVQYNAIGIF